MPETHFPRKTLSRLLSRAVPFKSVISGFHCIPRDKAILTWSPSSFVQSYEIFAKMQLVHQRIDVVTFGKTTADPGNHNIKRVIHGLVWLKVRSNVVNLKLTSVPALAGLAVSLLTERFVAAMTLKAG